jgi:ATP-dependent RNA helicase SUPV3L1/SUV3
VESLEQLDEWLRAGVKQAGGMVLPDQAREALGWSEADTHAILRGLGFAPARKAAPGEAMAWRRLSARAETAAPAPPRPNSPFAALAALKAQPAPPRRRRRKRRAAAP